MKLGTFLNLATLVGLMVIGAFIWLLGLLPTWLYVSGFLLLTTGLAIYSYRDQGLRQALGRFFKDLFFGW